MLVVHVLVPGVCMIVHSQIAQLRRLPRGIETKVDVGFMWWGGGSGAWEVVGRVWQ